MRREFERPDDYRAKIFMDALDRHVILDAELSCVYQSGKSHPRVYCKETRTYVQFPRKLRRYERKFVADVIKAKRSTGQIFYRAYPESIRDFETGEILA